MPPRRAHRDAILRRVGYARQRRLTNMRALSITSFLIQACIVSVAIWPDPVNAQDSGPAAFRIEISQPEYDFGAGHTWTCLAADIVQSKCWQSVPLIMFGRPTSARIYLRIKVSPFKDSPLKEKAVEIHASLDHSRAWYRASGGRWNPLLVLNSDDALAKEIKLQYWGENPDPIINPVVRRSPDESLALKITPVAAR
jgi:hypothetical protein